MPIWKMFGKNTYLKLKLQYEYIEKMYNNKRVSAFVYSSLDWLLPLTSKLKITIAFLSKHHRRPRWMLPL
jgi:hypothetical protein